MQLTPNVALGGTATQSETYPDNDWPESPFVASHANDGIFNTSMNEIRGACSHTTRDAPVWWQVELQEVYEITKVAITQRKEWASKLCFDFFLYLFYITVITYSEILKCIYLPHLYYNEVKSLLPNHLHGRYS